MQPFQFLPALLLSLGALGALLVAPAASAQPWPARQPIHLISPYAQGGTTDVLARLLAQKLSEKLHQAVVVENHGGSGGNLGTDLVAKADSDGYTLLLAASGPLVISPSLYSKLPYNPMKDFTFIAPLANAAFVVVANSKSGLNTLADVVSQGRQDGKLVFASAGSGTPQHIIGELFNIRAGTKIRHIPYKGSGPAMNDLVAGQVPLAFENPVAAMQHIQSGRLKVLAVTGNRRLPRLPDVPTVAELGYPGFDARPWYGLLAPAYLPEDITLKLNSAVQEILEDPAVRQRLGTLGAEPMKMTPEQFHSFVNQELQKWTRVVKASGATVD